MKEVNAGRDINIRGDFVIHDQSQEFKLLIHCSNQELLDEEQFRRINLANERKGKFKKFILLITLAACAIFAGGVWFWLQGKIDLFSIFTGIASFILGLASLEIYKEPTVFEQRQLAAIEEIHMLLRERRVL